MEGNTFSLKDGSDLLLLLYEGLEHFPAFLKIEDVMAIYGCSESKAKKIIAVVKDYRESTGYGGERSDNVSLEQFCEVMQYTRTTVLLALNTTMKQISIRFYLHKSSYSKSKKDYRLYFRVSYGGVGL